VVTEEQRYGPRWLRVNDDDDDNAEKAPDALKIVVRDCSHSQTISTVETTPHHDKQKLRSDVGMCSEKRNVNKRPKPVMQWTGWRRCLGDVSSMTSDRLYKEGPSSVGIQGYYQLMTSSLGGMTHFAS